MNYFLLITGFILVITAIVMFILDSKKESNEVRNLEMVNEQTEQLIEELSEISAIIVDEMDKKYSSMMDIYKELEGLAASKPKSGQEKPEPFMESGETRQEKVIMLNREGMPPSRIASHLGIGIGEVELILKLAGQGGRGNEKTI
ncbi:MAG: hypothetical protein HPY66_0278 [Firmicutes bacterium]|nr:hypothetical protein [Bacillota bacterium]MDI6704700.1 hypothetical protein [Bacillota bacterium]